MKRLLFTVFLSTGLILSFYVYGQDTIAKSEHKAKHIEKVEKPNAIFFAPFNLFDFHNPNFQIGYERFFSKKWALQIEGGIIINHSVVNYLIDWIKGIKVRNCLYTNKGFRVKGSVKYVIVDERRMKLYVSPELFYLRNKSGIVRDFLVSDPDFEYSWGISEQREGALNYYNQFFYNDEEKFGVNFKAGIKLFLGKHFFMEPHLGLGFAYRNVIQTGRENPNDELWDFFGIFDIAAQNRWVPTIPFNFKVGLRF